MWFKCSSSPRFSAALKAVLKDDSLYGACRSCSQYIWYSRYNGSVTPQTNIPYQRHYLLDQSIPKRLHQILKKQSLPAVRFGLWISCVWTQQALCECSNTNKGKLDRCAFMYWLPTRYRTFRIDDTLLTYPSDMLDNSWCLWVNGNTGTSQQVFSSVQHASINIYVFAVDRTSTMFSGLS